MPREIDTRFYDLANELLGGMDGCTPEDIINLAWDLQDDFEEAAETIEDRQPPPEEPAR